MNKYKEKFWANRAERYYNTNWVQSDKLIDTFLGMIPKNEYESILEIGIGTGAVAEKTASNIGPLNWINKLKIKELKKYKKIVDFFIENDDIFVNISYFMLLAQKIL